MLWARLGEANNLFTEYGVLTDSKCLANSSEVTKCLELERGHVAQLVERDHAEGRWFLSSQDTALSIFWYLDSPRCGSTLGIGLEGVTFAWPPQLASISAILAAGTQNTSPLKCSWRGRQGTPVGDTCSGPCQQRKNSMLLSWILEYPKGLSRQQSQCYSTHILPLCMNCTVIPPFSFLHK